MKSVKAALPREGHKAALNLCILEAKHMPVVNVSLQVLPKVSEDRVYPVVDKVIELIAGSGVKYEVGPMETTMEGEYDQLMDLVKQAHELCIEEGASRVVSVVKVDYKPGGVTMAEKVGRYR
jgi:uncharacterized protein (TIGR00106 family)